MDPAHLLEPSLRGRYKNPVEIGRGGMGVVLKAQDGELDRPVAIKVLQASTFEGGKARDRFLEEGRICSQLVHPHIVRLYDVGAPTGPFPPYMIFEFVEGRSLEDLHQVRGFPVDETLEILAGVADGLAFAHKAGITHRDLKAENVLMAGGTIPKVSDFGLAKARGSSSGVRTRQGLLLGTPPYMAPEYIRGDALGPPADVYAFGVMAFRLLSGQLPYDHANAVEILRMHVSAPVPKLREVAPGVGQELADVVTRCLAKDPKQRFENAGALGTALAAARSVQPRGVSAPVRIDQSSPATQVSAVGGRSKIDRRMTTAAGEAGAPRSQAFRRRTATAAGVAVGVGVLLLALARTGIFAGTRAEGLEVVASDRALEACWVGTGQFRLEVASLEGGVRTRAELPVLRDGLWWGRASSLNAGTDYVVRVVDGSGRLLQSATVTTSRVPADPRAVLRLDEAGKPLLEVVSPAPVGVRWDAGPGFGGSSARAAEHHRLVLEGIDAARPLRLVVATRPAGEEAGEEQVLTQDSSAFRRAAEWVFAGLTPEILGERLDDYWKLLNKLGTGGDPPALDTHLFGKASDGAGRRAALAGLLAAAPGYFASPLASLGEKLESEARLVALAYFDQIREGFRHPPVAGLDKLRQALLPQGIRSVLPAGARELGRKADPTFKGTDRPMALFSSEFRIHIERHGLSAAPVPQMMEDFLWYNRHRSDLPEAQLELEIASVPRAGARVELELATLAFLRRYFIALEVNGRGPLLLWPQEAQEERYQLDSEPYRSYHELPADWVKPGTNVLRFTMVDVPGPLGAVPPLKIRGVAVWAEP